MERGPRPDLEIVFEKNHLFVHRHPALSIVDRVQGIRMNKHPPGDDIGFLLGGEDIHRRRRREHIGKREKTDGDAESRSDDATEQKYPGPTPHGHLSQ